MNISMYLSSLRDVSVTVLTPWMVPLGALSMLLLFAALGFALGFRGQRFYTRSPACTEGLTSTSHVASASHLESALRAIMWVQLLGGLAALAAAGVGLAPV